MKWMNECRITVVRLEWVSWAGIYHFFRRKNAYSRSTADTGQSRTNYTCPATPPTAKITAAYESITPQIPPAKASRKW